MKHLFFKQIFDSDKKILQDAHGADEGTVNPAEEKSDEQDENKTGSEKGR